MSKPIVAIVGRPNVGKSTLFNKIAGQRLSIVEDTPGVTRDRIFYDTDWRGVQFTIVDTGGIEPRSDDIILAQMRRQAELAIESADVIVMLTDIQTGMTATDQEVAQMLLRSKKEIILCVNKVDRPGEPPAELYEFYNLGLGDPLPISGTHGMGVGDLLDAICDKLKNVPQQEEDSESIKVAVIGKPNVGKSSLVNRILGEERLIVSNIPGTTRDAIDASMQNEYGKFLFIDTAGIRRKSRVDDAIERYSVVRSYMAVDRADVVLMLIDATEGLTEQDTKIFGYAHEQGKAAIVVVNKWDAVEKDDNTMNEMRKKIAEDLKFMSYAPMLFISAKTGQRVDKLFQMIVDANEQHSRRVQTGMLNDVLADCVAKVQPPSDKGKRLKLYYMTQVSTRPPAFVVFTNDIELFHFSYQRYIENQLRETFGFIGTPIRIIPREKSKDGR